MQPTSQEKQLQFGEYKIIVREIVDTEFGYFTWPSANILATYIVKNKEQFVGCTVLEVRTFIFCLIISVCKNFKFPSLDLELV